MVHERNMFQTQEGWRSNFQILVRTLQYTTGPLVDDIPDTRPCRNRDSTKMPSRFSRTRNVPSLQGGSVYHADTRTQLAFYINRRQMFTIRVYEILVCDKLRGRRLADICQSISW